MLCIHIVFQDDQISEASVVLVLVVCCVKQSLVFSQSLITQAAGEKNHFFTYTILMIFFFFGVCVCVWLLVIRA